MNLSVLYNINYGMYILGVSDKDKPTGCVVNSVIQITSENPIIAVSINKKNYSYEVLKHTSKFSISILSEDADPKLISRFGFYSGRDVEKFSGFPYELSDGVPIITEKSCGSLICQVLSIDEMETHAVVFARLIDTVAGPNKNPMSYSFYHKVLKGTTSKYAPTFQTAVPEGQYVCDICGYVYEGDINQEDDSYRCPICGATKEHFIKKVN